MPGFLITALLMLVVHLHGYPPPFPEIRVIAGRFSLRNVLTTLPRAWVAVLAPVIILGGIMAGFHGDRGRGRESGCEGSLLSSHAGQRRCFAVAQHDENMNGGFEDTP